MPEPTPEQWANWAQTTDNLWLNMLANIAGHELKTVDKKIKSLPKADRDCIKESEAGRDWAF